MLIQKNGAPKIANRWMKKDVNYLPLMKVFLIKV